MGDKWQRILGNPAAYRQQQIDARVPDDFDELPEEEQQEIMAALEDAVISIDPMALKEEIGQLDKLVAQALLLEKREVESKLRKLREVLTQQGIFEDPKMKLLIFTEHIGHSRLPRREDAGRMAPVGDPDSWRHEDRRPRHTG